MNHINYDCSQLIQKALKENDAFFSLTDGKVMVKRNPIKVSKGVKVTPYTAGTAKNMRRLLAVVETNISTMQQGKYYQLHIDSSQMYYSLRTFEL